MRKLLIALCLVLLVPGLSWGAILAPTIWELEADSTANNVNGGGFDPITNAANFLADLSCHSGCDGATPVVSSASYSFVAADVNNWLYVSSGTGWTSGWYKITAVDVVTAGHAQLAAASGEAVQGISPNLKANTVAGCAVADSTGGVFTIDYSQSATAIDTGTDLASVAASVTLSSASTITFTPVMVGNMIHITTTGTGGYFTIGWYRIVSYVGATSVTVDRIAAAATDGAGGTAYIGGACKLGSSTTSMNDDDLIEAMVPGNTMYIKAGTYSLGAAIANSENGTYPLPFYFIGYNATRGDNPTGANRPVINTTTLAINSSNYNQIKNLIVYGAVNGTVWTTSISTLVDNCKFYNAYAGSGKTAISLTNGNRMTNSEAYANDAGSNFGIAVNMDTSGSILFGNYIHDSATCVSISSGSAVLINNIIANCSTVGAKTSTNAKDIQYFIGNTFFGGDHATADAVDLTTVDFVFFYNNIFANWNYAILNPGDYLVSDYNDFWSNDTDGITLGPHDLTLDPGFSNTSTGDFRIGVNLKAKGFPNGVALSGTAATSLGYTDMGALQRVEPSGGGGAWAQ
jgi:hypothetical protein